MVKKSALSLFKLAYQKLHRTLFWLLGIIVVILIIAALLIEFVIFPNINQYKDQIAHQLSILVQQKVAIGQIKAGWLGINPHVVIDNISILDAQNRPGLQLINTDASLSWLSLAALEPRFALLTIRAPELTIRRTSNGEIFVAGISMQGKSKPELPNWLLRQSVIHISHAKVIWLDEMRNAPSLSLNNLELSLSSPPWRRLIKNHQVSLSALPSVGTKLPVNIIANLYGNDVSNINQWHGTLAINVSDADIAAFKPWLDYPLDIQAGFGSTKLNMSFEQGRVTKVSSDSSLKRLIVPVVTANTNNGNSGAENTGSKNTLAFNQLTGKISWQDLKNYNNLADKKTGKNHFTVAVNNLNLVTNKGDDLRNVNANYTQTANDTKSIKLSLAHINLAAISPYALQLPLPADVSERISKLAPEGNLDQLEASWQSEKGITKTYHLNTKFSYLGIKAHTAQALLSGASTQEALASTPGFDGLTGEIEANQYGGKLQLNTSNANLDFSGLLRWPITNNQINGEVNWAIYSDNTKITTKTLEIRNPHLAGSVNATYTIDNKDGDVIDLKGNFGEVIAKYAPFYYPTTLNEETLHWLDTSILAGNVDDIVLTIKGRAKDFPFVDANHNLNPKLGLFRVTAKMRNGTLEYGAGWPILEGLNTDLLFEGTRMELTGFGGHIFGNQLIKSKTTIAQLDADSPILNVVAEVQGPVTEGVRFVNKSPVATLTQGFTANLKTSGAGKLNISLKIPLQNIDTSEYKGLYQITNGSVQSNSIPTLTQINGNLVFTENSLSANNVKANVFSSAVAFSLISTQDKTIRINAKGRINDQTIEQTLGAANNYISGSANWLGSILVQDSNVNIAIRSDLIGITSKLPAPFNKQENDILSLRVDQKQSLNNELTVINIGNKLNAKITRTAASDRVEIQTNTLELHHAVIQLNNATSNTANDASLAKGLYISGSLDYLNTDAWRKVLKELSAASVKQTDSTALSNQLNLPIKKLDIKVDKLDIFDRRVNQIKIQNKVSKDSFVASIQSREITGELQWVPKSTTFHNGKLIARLSNLSIPEATADSVEKNTEADKTFSDKEFKKLIQDYPALDITSTNFEFDNKKLGAIELAAYPQDDNWIIQKLKLDNADSTLTADGEWHNWAREPNTKLNIAINTKDLGKTIQRFGYPDTIRDGEGDLSGQLNWAGSPHEFNMNGLNGNLKFILKKGQILKVQPGVGRLLGLLSLQSLPRRLSLDFSDLFSSGFAFDKINGTVKINRGVLSSDNFVMAGPAADVSIKGEISIPAETQLMQVQVNPRISDSFSLAALAGGPLVGAVAFLAQKLFKDPLNKIASSTYYIGGTWDNPQEIKQPKVEQSNPLSN